MYGIRVAFAHESRVFGLPVTTVGHPADIPLEALEHRVVVVAHVVPEERVLDLEQRRPGVGTRDAPAAPSLIYVGGMRS